MQDFKDKKALRTPTPAERMENPVVASLAQEAPGWYEGSLDFKRVVMVPATGKFEYRDTHFVADVKAESGLDCYNRIVDYLRDCVDSRSQFPSAKVRISISAIWECGNRIFRNLKDSCHEQGYANW